MIMALDDLTIKLSSPIWGFGQLDLDTMTVTALKALRPEHEYQNVQSFTPPAALWPELRCQIKYNIYTIYNAQIVNRSRIIPPPIRPVPIWGLG